MFHVPALEPPQTWLTVMKEIPVLELVVVKSLQALDMTQRKSTTSFTEFHRVSQTNSFASIQFMVLLSKDSLSLSTRGYPVG